MARSTALQIPRMKWTRRQIQLRLLTLVVLVLLCVLVIVVTAAGERTFQLSARSWGGELVFHGDINRWELDEATICALREIPDLRAPEGSNGQTALCDLRFYEEISATGWRLDWPDGARIQFQKARSGEMQFLLENAAAVELPNTQPGPLKTLLKGSLIIVPHEAWVNHGALAFNAVVVIGGRMATSSKDYLISGRWEARQTGPATALFRDLTEVVKSGSLSLGATVDFIRLREFRGTATEEDYSLQSADEICGIRADAMDGDPFDVVSYGYITPANDEGGGVDLALLTEKSPLALRVRHYGLEKPACFRPDWIDTISASPMILALAILFSFIAVTIELVLAINNARNEFFEE